jgi:vanillate/3-O-methylgallate O-demethylase
LSNKRTDLEGLFGRNVDLAAKDGRHRVVLMDQSHHMDSVFIRGRDAFRLVSETAVTSVNFPVNTAKQYIPLTPAGHVIGDGIVHREAGDELIYVGRSPAANWLLFHAEPGGYDVDVTVDRRSPSHPLGPRVVRTFWRFQIRGPRAWDLIEKINGGPVEKPRLFHESYLAVGGVRARILRHGMAGAPGLELWGPYKLYHQVRDAILHAGAEFGIVPAGARAYPLNAVDFPRGTWVTGRSSSSTTTSSAATRSRGRSRPRGEGK